VLLAYASDLFVLCTIERPWLREEAEAITTALASLVELSREAVSLQLFLETIRTPELLDLPPTIALQTPTPTAHGAFAARRGVALDQGFERARGLYRRRR